MIDLSSEEERVAEVVHFRKSERAFDAYGNDPRKATISRLVGPELSKTMGAGIARFEGATVFHALDPVDWRMRGSGSRS